MPSIAQNPPLDSSNHTNHLLTTAAVVPTTRRLTLPARIATAVLAALLAGALALVLTPATPAEAAIPIPIAAKYHPRLKYGVHSPAVPYIKKRLGRTGSSSSYYGRDIERLVNKWRKAHNMSRSGVVGERMWDLLGVPHIPRPGSAWWGRLVMKRVSAHAGDPYRYGAAGPHAFDCSGLTMYVMRQMGISLTHSASEQKRSSHVRLISRSNRRVGDLVFVNSGSGASHAAIYAGNGQWWESPHSGSHVLKRSIWTSNVSYGRLKY